MTIAWSALATSIVSGAAMLRCTCQSYSLCDSNSHWCIHHGAGNQYSRRVHHMHPCIHRSRGDRRPIYHHQCWREELLCTNLVFHNHRTNYRTNKELRFPITWKIRRPDADLYLGNGCIELEGFMHAGFDHTIDVDRSNYTVVYEL